MSSNSLPFKIITLDRVNSTNSYAKEWISIHGIEEKTVFLAQEQYQGKGQQGNSWHSERGMNITLSIILTPSWLALTHQFHLNKCLSLGIKDYLLTYFPANKIAIKWPNDLYVNNKKIAGLLIESAFSENQFDYIIVGIGLNINQKTFNPSIPNPTSLHIETGNHFDIMHETNRLLACIHFRYHQLEHNENQVHIDYLNQLYQLGIMHTYSTTKGKLVGKMIGVNDAGQLKILDNANHLHLFNIKEVSF